MNYQIFMLMEKNEAKQSEKKSFPNQQYGSAGEFWAIEQNFQIKMSRRRFNRERERSALNEPWIRCDRIN